MKVGTLSSKLDDAFLLCFFPLGDIMTAGKGLEAQELRLFVWVLPHCNAESGGWQGSFGGCQEYQSVWTK